MATIHCVNPVNHAGCSHGGWREHRLNRGDVQALNAARMAANWASKDLGLDLISIKFFEPGSIFDWSFGDSTVDKSLVQLNAGTFDPELLGRAVDPHLTPLPTVWVRSGLSPALTAVTVLHEARHIWHVVTGTGLTEADEEQDAVDYGWRATLVLNRKGTCE